MAKYWTDDEGLENMKKFCVEQDRCQKEVRTKLISHQIYGERTEGIIADLILEGYLDEQRYANSYVRGKFRMNKWGKIKIKQGLKEHEISDFCIKKAFKEIDDEEYLNTLTDLLRKKQSSIAGNSYQKKQKLLQYALSKGYENYVIEIALENLNSE